MRDWTYAIAVVLCVCAFCVAAHWIADTWGPDEKFYMVCPKGSKDDDQVVVLMMPENETKKFETLEAALEAVRVDYTGGRD